jgi:anti-sigma-K factor RskA
MDDRRRVRAALRVVYGTPPAESIDWWSLRSRILDAAGFPSDRVRRRTLWDRALWRRALIPVTFAATIVMALAIADTRSGVASSLVSAVADSTEVTAWLRAASAGGAVTQRELDPLLDASGRIRGGQDAWLGAALTATSD